MPAVAPVIFLVVSIMSANGQLIDTATYNKATWPTVIACQEFVASDAGQASLAGLLAAVQAQVDPTATLKPECTDVPAAK